MLIIKLLIAALGLQQNRVIINVINSTCGAPTISEQIKSNVHFWTKVSLVSISNVVHNRLESYSVQPIGHSK